MEMSLVNDPAPGADYAQKRGGAAAARAEYAWLSLPLLPRVCIASGGGLSFRPFELTGPCRRSRPLAAATAVGVR